MSHNSKGTPTPIDSDLTVTEEKQSVAKAAEEAKQPDPLTPEEVARILAENEIDA